MRLSLRLPETEHRYQIYLSEDKAIQCCFCREREFFKNSAKSAIIAEWTHWYLMFNEFPYDQFYQKHDLLFPKRHVEKGELTMNEMKEYNRIISNYSADYHQKMENLGDRISQPGHYHIHLLKFRN